MAMLVTRSARALLAWPCLAALSSIVHGQTLEHRWLGGYEMNAPPPFGGNKTAFLPGTMLGSVQEDRVMFFSRTVACLSNAEDSAMVYTNGIYVSSIEGDSILNGWDLNPSLYIDELYGCAAANSHILLPWPAHKDSFAMFHMAVDTFNTASLLISRRFYVSVIDMALENGLGAVVEKNAVLDVGDFCVGGVSAVKHGNGRDWWVYMHSCGNNDFVRFLLTPDGVSGPWYQSIGETRNATVPSAVFTRDGEHFAHVDAFTYLDVYDVDRCTGEFYNLRHAEMQDSLWAAHAAFAPGGRFLYVTHIDRVYQYDMEAPDLEASEQIIAVWDSTYDPSPPFALLFNNICLAPDNRIYISTGNGSRFMHVIDQPDSAGAACNFLHSGHSRITYTDNSIPYRPNYTLGPLLGSSCDTLGLAIAETVGQPHILVHPNPTSGPVRLCFPSAREAGSVQVFSALGTLVLEQTLSPGANAIDLDLSPFDAGMLMCRCTWPSATLSTRIILSHRQ